MKVIKRDGRVVDYDRTKVAIAIEKANNEVIKKEKASKEDIKIITNYIEELDKKRMLVEDIQDIIEEKLMELGKYKLAKKYIVYRYTRALVRKSNTTDETILGLIRNENKEISEKNQNKNTVVASTQRDYIAGEVSRDLTKRLLLPEKISKANDEGILYFHDADYFVQPIFNWCLIDIKDMLDNGTVLNGKMIETPKSFKVACIVMTQIIATVASNQYGGQAVNLQHLGKYLRKSKEKIQKELKQEYGNELNDEIITKMTQKSLKEELKSGVQTIEYQLNTTITTNGRTPNATLFLYLDQNDEYFEENAMIIEELLKQRDEGIKNSDGVSEIPIFPKIIYNDTGQVFSQIEEKDFLEPWKDENGNYKFEGRFNQGEVSINLPQIAIIADGDEDEFWKLLDERLELCKEALMCRHYALLGTISDISPIHWQYGAIARLNEGEKIDKLLYGGYSSITLGYVGTCEMTELMTKETDETEKGKSFILRVEKYMQDKIKKWKKETNIGFSLCKTQEKSVCYNFAQIDKEKFGTIKNVTDKGYYTNSLSYNDVI